MVKEVFFQALFEKMKNVDPVIPSLEFYEFKYLLKNMDPGETGWESITILSEEEILTLIDDDKFYYGVRVMPQKDGITVLDEKVKNLSNMLFIGLVSERYSTDWVKKYFYFDVRGFVFIPRTFYFTEPVLNHFGGKPYKTFEKKQKGFDTFQGIGYRDFMDANAEVDEEFTKSILKIIQKKRTPIVIGIAGPTAAGKTEIVERLKAIFNSQGKRITNIEMDNYFTDRELREKRGVHSMGKEALHFDLLIQTVKDISSGKKIFIPEYNYLTESSSHDEFGRLKPGHKAIEVEPADIIFIEGNFPFLFEEIIPYIGIKVVYLTDDPIRLKRKWKRDIDYLKKYEQVYFVNRYFRTQKPKANACYIPQLASCDIAVYTTGAELWVSEETKKVL